MYLLKKMKLLCDGNGHGHGKLTKTNIELCMNLPVLSKASKQMFLGPQRVVRPLNKSYQGHMFLICICIFWLSF